MDTCGRAGKVELGTRRQGPCHRKRRGWWWKWASEALGPVGGVSVQASAEAFLKTLVCDSKGVFLILRKVETIILLKELEQVKPRSPEARGDRK